MKDTVNKLYQFIARLVVMMEEELDELGDSRGEIVSKKNIADMLGKLVTLIIQLNKLSKNESLNSEIVMPEEDQQIIARFLEKYNTRHCK
jgi:uncharacterized protein (UPF0335 family)